MGRSHQSKTHRLLEHFGILLALATKMFFHNAKYNMYYFDANAIRKKHLLRTILLSSYVVKNLFQIEMPFRVTFVRTIEYASFLQQN